MAGWNLTDPFHREPYPTISPTRPELSQAGRTVLVTGGSQGIGFAISKAFLQASAAKVVILGREQATLDEAVKDLNNSGYKGQAVGKVCNVADAAATAELWKGLAAEGTVVDVLVLNAAATSVATPLLELGADNVWAVYAMNARAQLDFAERFYKQTSEGVGSKYLVNISTLAIHDWDAGKRPVYGLTKNAGALIMQLVARDTPPEVMQVISVNPGPNLTRAARQHGYKEGDMQWNDVDLTGQFAVWAASPEARFLHGRFVWAEWDVDQLRAGALRKKIDADPDFLKIGIKGL